MFSKMLFKMSKVVKLLLTVLTYVYFFPSSLLLTDSTFFKVVTTEVLFPRALPKIPFIAYFILETLSGVWFHVFLFACGIRCTAVFISNLPFSIALAVLAGNICQQCQSGIIRGTCALNVLYGLLGRSHFLQRFDAFIFHFDCAFGNLHLNFNRFRFCRWQWLSDNIWSFCKLSFFCFIFPCGIFL